MPRDDVATELPELREPDAPLDASGIAALFVRCLIVGSVIAVAAWLAINWALARV